MCRTSTVAVQSVRAKSIASRSKSAGFAGRTVGCLTKGPQSPEEAVTALLASSRGNLLHPDVRFAGIATTAGRWTVILGTR